MKLDAKVTTTGQWGHRSPREATGLLPLLGTTSQLGRFESSSIAVSEASMR